MTQASDKSIFQTLWDRKVPQYLGTYFAIGFGLLQFLEFLVQRYELSGSWIDKYLLVWLALVPAIAILSYYGHRLKENAKKFRFPKALVIINFVIAFLFGGLLFNGDIKAQQEPALVEIADEDGKIVKAVVPQLSKIKKIAIFQFKNETGKDELDWYGPAFSSLLHNTLRQRPEVYSLSAYYLNHFHERLGLPSFETPAHGMKMEIANKARSEYFTSLMYSITNDIIQVKGNLHRAKDGKKILALEAKNKSLYAVVDQLSEQINQFLFKGKATPDGLVIMPSSALLTSNIEALKYHSQSLIKFGKNPSALIEVLALEQKALDIDPTCAACQYNKADKLYGMGKNEEAKDAARLAIKYGKALPKRFQFYPKEMYYSITDNIEGYFKLLEMQRKMFPYEYRPYEKLLTKYRADYGIDSAKVLIQEAIDNGNVERGLLAMHDLQVENEEYDAALKTLENHKAKFPDRDQDKLKWVTLYELQGDFKAAKAILLEEEALDPLDASIQNRLVVLDFREQKFDAVDERLERGLRQASTLTDTVTVLWTKASFEQARGQVNQALSTLKNYEVRVGKMSPYNRVISSTFFTKALMYLSISDVSSVNQLLEEINTYSPEFQTVYQCQTDILAVQKEYKTLSTADELMKNCRDEYAKRGTGTAEFLDLVVAYKKEDYATAINILRKENDKLEKLVGRDPYFLSSIYNRGGDFEKAIEIVQKEIDRKTYDPMLYYQMAFLLQNDDREQAKKYLDIAMTYWKNADQDYVPYMKAKRLRSTLNEVKTESISL
ncbi:hypothetical protein GCM10009117_02440 [Gangjinia marincola]|uniref:Tetratricopeptide repeat protein n=1 Tax=Gangjinia marincola TaxID=578463 RepID=A0ABN1MDD2_9FLAO